MNTFEFIEKYGKAGLNVLHEVWCEVKKSTNGCVEIIADTLANICGISVSELENILDYLKNEKVFDVTKNGNTLTIKFVV